LKQNIPLSLDENIIQAGTVIAAQQGTSLNHLLQNELERIIRNRRQYNFAKKRLLLQ
jgi:uncharacterized cupin superfamily protein